MLTCKQGSDHPPLAEGIFQNSFPSLTIEFTEKNLFSGIETQATLCHGDELSTYHYLTFREGNGIVLTGAVMLVVADRRMGSMFFQPFNIIIVLTEFFIID